MPVPLSHWEAGPQTECLQSVVGLPGDEVAASEGLSPAQERAQGDQQWDQVTEGTEMHLEEDMQPKV